MKLNKNAENASDNYIKDKVSISETIYNELLKIKAIKDNDITYCDK
jgi:hypothetical protein